MPSRPCGPRTRVGHAGPGRGPWFRRLFLSKTNRRPPIKVSKMKMWRSQIGNHFSARKMRPRKTRLKFFAVILAATRTWQKSCLVATGLGSFGIAMLATVQARADAASPPHRAHAARARRARARRARARARSGRTGAVAAAPPVRRERDPTRTRAIRPTRGAHARTRTGVRAPERGGGFGECTPSPPITNVPRAPPLPRDATCADVSRRRGEEGARTGTPRARGQAVHSKAAARSTPASIRPILRSQARPGVPCAPASERPAVAPT
jgi:hypothetical protein